MDEICVFCKHYDEDLRYSFKKGVYYHLECTYRAEQYGDKIAEAILMEEGQYD
jgi:hypothetical protein